MSNILTPDQRLRVFISGEPDELAAERKAAARAVESLRLVPVLVEDAARPHARADLLRSYIEQSHVFVGIYGAAYGWVLPGERSQLEDEYDLSEGLPRLLYLKAVDERDPPLIDLLERIGAGNHSYKSFRDANELGSLLVDDLALLLTESFTAASTRPPTSLERPTSVLPVHPTSLVGRDRDVREVATLLERDDVRLVTLTGPGGIGKTRLALEVAARETGRFADGIQHVLLAALVDPNLVMPTIAHALGVRESRERSTAAQIADFLRDREMLLVLDNFEHVLGAATAISMLVAAAPRVKLLVTSRAALSLLGEHEYEVQPLDVPEEAGRVDVERAMDYPAVALFVDRAQATNAAFQLTTENLSTVIDICSRLDGIPLAIELAASRSRSLSPQMILDRLRNRLKLLSRGPRDLPERQQTLRALLDWDYELLSENERLLFRRLAVFARGFTFDGAEKVALPAHLDELDLLELLDSLVRRSLLRQETPRSDEPRFGMLKTLREYGLERLEESEDSEETRRRHAEYFLALAETASDRLREEDQVHWLDVLDAEHDNMRAALRWVARAREAEMELRLAGALAKFWEFRAHLTEGQRWLEQALSRGTNAPPEIRARCLDGAGILARAQGELKRAQALLEEAVALRRELGDAVELANSLRNLANVLFDRDGLEETRAIYEESLSLYRSAGDDDGAAAVLNNLGVLSFYLQEWDRAEELYEQSLVFFRRERDLQGIARSLMNLGEIKVEQGDPVTGGDYFKESFELFIRLGARWDIAYTLEGMANVLRARGEPVAGATLFGAAETLRELLGAPLPPSEVPPHQRNVGKVRAALDPETFEAAWKEGRAMDMDAAVAFALSL